MNHNYKNIDGWFDFETIYNKMVSKAVDGSVFVEIGLLKGKSFNYLATELVNRNIDVELHGIDKLLLTEFIETLPRYSDKKIKISLHQMDSIKASKCYEDKSIDFLFIDSDHTYEYTLQEIKAWLPKVKDGGYIGGHDYVKEYPGVIKAVNEIFVGLKELKIIGSGWLYYNVG